MISGFLCENLLGFVPEEGPKLSAMPAVSVSLPPEMLGTDALAQFLTGKQMRPGTELWDVYVPQFEGRPLDPNTIVCDVGRGAVMQVFAQMECALKTPK